jgi:hypothetical protein
MFKPYEIHDEKERVEIEHQLYLKSPELRKIFLLNFI